MFPAWKSDRQARSGGSFRRTLIASVVGSCSLFVASGARAQTATPPTDTAAKKDQSGQLENITVTARRREEKLQNVPAQVVAITGKELGAAGAQDLRDITFLVPGITLYSNGAEADETPVIRGQVDIGSAAIGRNNVPVFFDGIYIAQSSAIDFGLIDLARVEVIEGPVSSLYGHSGYAGAVNYVSAKPSPDLYTAGIEYTVGDFGKENVKFDTSGPILPNILSGGVSGSYDSFDGTYHDSSTGQSAGGDERKDIFGNLDFTPNDSIEIRPEIYYGSDFFGPAPTIAGPGNCGVGFNITQCGQVPDGTFGSVHVADPADGQTGNNRTVLTTNILAKYVTDYGTLSSQTGYNNIRSTQYSEFDLTSFGEPVQTYLLPPGAINYTIPPGGLTYNYPLGPLATLPLHFGYQQRERDFSEELRWTSPQDQRFRYMLGAYYSKSVLVQDLRLGIDTTNVPAGYFIESPFATPPGQAYSGQQTLDQLEDRFIATYGAVDFDILPNLTVSGQLRWQQEAEAFEQPYAVYDPYDPGYSTGAPSVFNPYGTAAQQQFYSVTTRDSISYKPIPEVMIYASVANGEKGGGFNNGSATLPFTTFAPETNWTEEAGFKSTLLNNHLQFNADYFHIQSANYQVSAPASASQVGNFITSNLGGLTTDGVESSVAVKPVQGVTFQTGIAYADPRFDSNSFDYANEALCAGIPSCASRIVTHQDFGKPTQAVSLSGLRPPYESNLTFNASLSLDYPIYEDYHWFGRGDYRFQSSAYYQYPEDLGHYGPLNNLNLRTGISKGLASVTFFVDNVTNDRTPLTVQDSYASGGDGAVFFESAHFFPEAVLPTGRTLGVTFKYRFNGARAPMPAPEPAPPAAATPVPPVTEARTYLVFFDWDRADLTERATQIVAAAAAASTHVQTTKIQVSGYTDLSGTAAYNQKLSVRRAKAVEKELEHDGVAANEIAIHGYGESSPLVPTAKGVREPQNRRVEIVLQ